MLHEQIDVQKWNACVERYGLPYGYSWYLDAVTQNHWNALVMGDYEVVMPLPFNRKIFGLYQIYQPMLCQQLGWFGSASLQANTFLLAIPDKYRKIALFVNKVDDPWVESLKARQNLILPLDKSIEEIRKSYSKSLRKRIRKAESSQVVRFDNEAVDELIETYRHELNDRLGWSSNQYEQAAKLFRIAIDKNQAVIAKVEEAGKLMAIGFFLKGNDRLINLFGASTIAGRQAYAMHLLLDRMIAFAKETALAYFDFEGSEIPGVEAFFRSFGSQAVPYFQYERNSLPTFINWALERRS